jgi:hypothetical protein
MRGCCPFSFLSTVLLKNTNRFQKDTTHLDTKKYTAAFLSKKTYKTVFRRKCI